MSQSSNYGYAERIDDDAFAADRPVSAAQAWLLRNNLQHWRDMRGEVRLFGTVATNPTTETIWIGHPKNEVTVTRRGRRFFHTWLDEQTPLNLEAGVTFSTGAIGVDGTLRMRVVPAYKGTSTQPTAAGDLSLPALVDETVEFEDMTVQIILGIYRFDPEVVANLGIRPTAFDGHVIENGRPTVPRAYCMRLDAILTATPSYLAATGSFYVREFI